MRSGRETEKAVQDVVVLGGEAEGRRPQLAPSSVRAGRRREGDRNVIFVVRMDTGTPGNKVHLTRPPAVL